MIRFTEKDLYEVEQGKFNRFLNKKMQTKTEYNQDSQYNTGDEEAELDMSSVIGGDTFDFDSGTDDGWDDSSGLLGGSDGGWGGGLEAGDKSGVSSAVDWKHQSWVKTWLLSPLYIVKYVAMDIAMDFPKKNEWEFILTALNKINVIAGVVAIVVMLLGLNSPFTPIVQLGVAVISFFATSFALKVLYNKGIFAKEKVEGESEEETLGEEEEPLGLLGGESDGFDDLGGDFTGFDFGDNDGLLEGDEEDEDDEEEDLNKRTMIGDSPIVVDDDDEFNSSLLDVFAENNKYMGRVINERMQILQSFSKYIITNDRNFGKYKSPKERSVEYNNIAYTLFKGLVAIDNRFESDENKLTILSIKRSPLLYKVEVLIPSYFRAEAIQRKLSVFEDVLKATPDDKDVAVLVTFYQGRFVFKFIRFDSKTLVAIGDILRFQGDAGAKGTALEQFADADKGVPVLIGLQDNELPYVIDFELNTSGAIVGGSNSGKSWLTFSMMENFIISNSYDHVQFIVLDAKNAPFWQAFARLPHVLGYHTDVNTFLEILVEVKKEGERRQALMSDYGAEDVKGLRKTLRKKGDYETMKKFPLLVVIMDEITATMLEYENMDDEKATYNEVRNLLGIIASKGRSSGLRVLTIGQRSIDKSIPTTLKGNSSFKFGMRMDAKNDFHTLFGDEVDKLKKPDMMGMGLISSMDYSGIHMLKTLTIGGTSNEQMLALIRVLAFEWLRRAKGNVDLTVPPEGVVIPLGFNRDVQYQKSVEELREGRILNRMTISKGYEVDLISGDSVSKMAPIERKPVMVNEDIKEDVKPNAALENTGGLTESSIDDVKYETPKNRKFLIPLDRDLNVGRFKMTDEGMATDEEGVDFESLDFDPEEDSEFNFDGSDGSFENEISPSTETSKGKILTLPDMESFNIFENMNTTTDKGADIFAEMPFDNETSESKIFEISEYEEPSGVELQEHSETEESKIYENPETDFFLDSEYGDDEDGVDINELEQVTYLESETDDETSSEVMSEISDRYIHDSENTNETWGFSEKSIGDSKFHFTSEVSNEAPSEVSSEVFTFDIDDLDGYIENSDRNTPRNVELQNTQNFEEEIPTRKLEEQKIRNIEKAVPVANIGQVQKDRTQKQAARQEERVPTRKEEDGVNSVAQIGITHRSTGVVGNIEPQETIESYIMTYGKRVDALTYSIPKEDLESVYTARKIKNALNLTLIFDDGDCYTVEV